MNERCEDIKGILDLKDRKKKQKWTNFKYLFGYPLKYEVREEYKQDRQ